VNRIYGQSLADDADRELIPRSLFQRNSMAENRTHFDIRHQLTVNPGLPKDFHPGVVKTYEHSEFYRDPDVVELIQSDDMPIPATEDRENYYEDRHIEYWLSGYADWTKLKPYLNGDTDGRRYLDFGGATGRVSRHSTREPKLETWLCDINVNWIAWIDRYFNRPIRAFQNRIQPSLPIEDKSFDLISAFSVFTHLDQDEMPWLLELRRIVRPGGYLYLTVLDENVWDRLKDPNWEWLLKSIARGKSDEYLAERCLEPLEERVVLEYSSAEAYNINTFLPRKYLEKKWGPLFSEISFLNDSHNYQTVVVLKRP
jgi:SAM-dependent methyltransferase